MSVNPIFHVCTKHIELDYHFVKKKVTQGKIVLHYLLSPRQIADIFTKALPKQAFFNFWIKHEVQAIPLARLKRLDKLSLTNGTSFTEKTKNNDNLPDNLKS